MDSDPPFTPEELLEIWQLTWFPLSDSQKQKFLLEEATRDLCKWQRSKVMKFLKVEKKLRVVLRDLRVEAQRIAELEWVRELDASRARDRELDASLASWCDICSCNHPPNQHHDRESYL